MVQHSWHRQYIAALLASKSDTVAQYESIAFLRTVLNAPQDGVQELVLHRTIARLQSKTQALALLDLLRESGWAVYASRVLARIADTEAVLAERPDLGDYFKTLCKATDFAPFSLKDWYLLTDGTDVQRPGAPQWAGRATDIAEILPDADFNRPTIDEVVRLLDHFFNANVRLYQVALLTSSEDDRSWAVGFHRLFTIPYIALHAPKPRYSDPFALRVPSSIWAPQWRVNLHRSRQDNWHIIESHTGIELNGLGAAGIFSQLGALLSLSGLLRDGITLSPIEPHLVRSLSLSHPIWGFRPQEFSAAGTTYQADDIRALALAFLEKVPATYRVSMFRSRLAMHFLSGAWSMRKSASVVAAENGFYRNVLRAAQLFGENRFIEVLQWVNDSPYRTEPALQFLSNEAEAALTLFDMLREAKGVVPYTIRKPDKVLCVMHSSVPEQNGGYAHRAHGILTHLRSKGIDISAVTRPGFPDGSLTVLEDITVDDVTYRRLPYSGVDRRQGEVQYMKSLIQPLKSMFKELGVAIVHLRSTFLTALPGLIAARQLGLKVIYEVSGLWELVYRDREKPSHLLRRSSFAETAETATMNGADQVVVMNEAVRQIVIGRGVRAEQVHIAPNAVDIDNFSPVEPPSNDLFTIGYLGSIQDYEGLDDLIDVVKLLKERNTPVRALIVGDGSRYRSLSLRIKKEGLQAEIQLTGRVPHSEVIDYYRQMDVLVYPRRSTGATESITPLKPFEALALAKPIIVSDVMPLMEIIGDNERGTAFESGNVEDFSRAVLQLQSDQGLRTRLGAAGRRWVVAHRNWDNVVNSFIEAYEK